MDKTKKVIFNLFIALIALVGVLNIIDCLYASTDASAENLTMLAKIENSATITIGASAVSLDVMPNAGLGKSDALTVSTYTNTDSTCNVLMTASSDSLSYTTGGTTYTIDSLESGTTYTDSTFQDDAWGYQVGSGDYKPVLTGSGANAITSFSNNTGSSATNTSVYFAAKLTPATKAGAYTNTVTFSTACAPIPNPTVTIATSNADSITIDGTTYTNGNTPTLTLGSHTISGAYPSGYEFDSWSATSNIIIADATSASTSIVVAGNGTLTLTGKSSVINYCNILSATYCMQSISTWASSISSDTEVTAMDARDGKTYTALKLSNGHMLMTQNLDHDIKTDGSVTYDSTTTDISSAWTPSTATTTTTTWVNSDNNGDNIPQSYDPGDLYWNGTLDYDYIYGTLSDSEYISNTGDSHYHVGNFYSWTAAVAMNDSSSYTADGTDAGQSICPAGWTLPTDTSGTGKVSWTNIYSAYGRPAIWYSSPLYFTLAGYWSGSSYYVGSYGDWWSREVKSSSYAYRFDVDLDGDALISSSTTRYSGRSVRCISR